MTLAAGDASPETSRQVLVECLRDFPEVRLTVSGQCMAPAVREGEVVTLVAASRRRPRLGDVVLAATPDGMRLHRLLCASSAGGWRIKADRAPTWDAVVGDGDILATAVAVGAAGRARPTRSASRWLRSLLAVAGAHARALGRPRPRV
jgi:hypothetical protein